MCDYITIIKLRQCRYDTSREMQNGIFGCFNSKVAKINILKKVSPC